MSISFDREVLLSEHDDHVSENSASGVFNWIIATNIVYADEAAAALFGFSRAEAEGGLPLDAYRSRIHPGDAARYSEAARQTVLGGAPFQLDYRVVRPDGTIVALSGFGACFRDGNGMPLYCAGMMVPTPTVEAPVDPFVHHCFSALEHIKGNQDQQLINMLAEVLHTYLSGNAAVRKH